MTTKEEALEIVKKHFVPSYPENYTLIEDVILEDEVIYMFILEQESYLRNGREIQLLGGELPFIIFDKKLKRIVSIDEYYEYTILNTLQRFYVEYKMHRGEKAKKEQVLEFFKPLYDYRIKRKWSISHLMRILKRGVSYTVNTRNIFNYIDDNRLRLGNASEDLMEVRDSFQGKYFQGLLYILKLKR